MSRFVRLAAFAIAALVAAGLAGCKEETASALPPRPVMVTTITPITTETFGPFVSTVEARYQTQLGFQVSGRMVARDVYVGDRVIKGQRLAALDPTVTQFALTRAKADVADAMAQLTNAEGIASRQKTLATGGNATQAALDNAVAGRDTAQARLDQSKASLRAAEDQIGYTELHANFDGVITAWSAEVGQYVSTGQNVVTIARPDIREAVVDIPDDLMHHVTPGMEFTTELQSAPEIKGVARVREIGPLADTATRTHRVRMTLVDPTPAFRLGTMLTVAVQTSIPPKIVIPATAVFGDGDAKAVWLLDKDGGHVRRRAISVLNTKDDEVVVGSGLTAGDEIVTVGVHSLTDGEAVGGAVWAKGTPL